MTDIAPPGSPDWCVSCWARHNGGWIIGRDHRDVDGRCDGCGALREHPC